MGSSPCWHRSYNRRAHSSRAWPKAAAATCGWHCARPRWMCGSSMHLMVFGEIGKAGERSREGELHRADGPRAMLGHDNLGHAAHGLEFVLPFEMGRSFGARRLPPCEVIFFAKDEEDHIGVLLDGAAIA